MGKSIVEVKNGDIEIGVRHTCSGADCKVGVDVEGSNFEVSLLLTPTEARTLAEELIHHAEAAEI